MLKTLLVKDIPNWISLVASIITIISTIITIFTSLRNRKSLQMFVKKINLIKNTELQEQIKLISIKISKRETDILDEAQEALEILKEMKLYNENCHNKKVKKVLEECIDELYSRIMASGHSIEFNSWKETIKKIQNLSF